MEVKPLLSPVKPLWSPTTSPITMFQGEHRFLSNFYSYPIIWKGVEYPTAEHLYQTLKVPATEVNWRARIRCAKTPGEAKRLGRRAPLRKNWELDKECVMTSVVNAKFSHLRHPDMVQKLLDTGSAKLVEGNTWHDNYWGSCVCTKCTHIPGENKLGEILMLCRRCWNVILNA